MSVHGALPNDIFVDEQGKLWRCVGYCDEPTAIFEEVEGRTPEPANYQHAAAQGAIVNYSPQRTPILKDRKSGGVNGLMWQGWKRIWRQGS